MENVRGITTFIRIVKTGTFSTAARDLGITPQAASLHVKQLEDWVGVRLFNRSTRKVSLTDEGARFYETCVAAVGAIEQQVERLRDTSQEIAGPIRIAAPVGIGSRFVAPAMARFLDEHPRLRVELVIQNRIPDMVVEGIDIGILPHPLPETSLIARQVISSAFILCASPLYHKRHGTPHGIDDLLNHRCIDFRSWITNTVRPWQFRVGQDIVIPKINACLVTNEAESEIAALLSGGGIGMVSLYRAAPYLRSARLVQVLPGQMVGKLDYSIFMQRREHIPKRIKVLVDFLFDELTTHPDLC